MKKYLKIVKVSFLTILIATLLLVCIIFLNLFLNYHSKDSIIKNTQGKNALWLKHQWVGNDHSDQEYVDLCNLFSEKQITDAFFHVGPLNEKGKIEKEKYLFAETLVVKMKECNPDVNLQSWIGQIEVKGGGILDIEDEEIRKNIISTADEFLDIGFDGIHYNIKPSYKGDQEIIDLLKQTKKITEEKGKILSIAGDELEPFEGSEKLARLLFERAGFWDEKYYLEVAQNVDQIAIMTYDTALPADWLYGNIMQWQTYNTLNLLGSEKTIFIGIPTYDEKSFGHNPKAENMVSGLIGIKKGLLTFDDDELQNFGVAIYAEWTTDDSEWDYYKENWVGH